MNAIQNGILIALDCLEGANVNGDIHPSLFSLLRAAEMVIVDRDDTTGLLIPVSEVMVGDTITNRF